MKKGFLMVVSGPSGVGKGTICDILLKGNEDIKYSISATSRERRPMEEHGKNYFFVSNEEFENMIEEGKLLEYAKVHGNYYGTPKDFVLKSVDSGDVVILEIDVQGALQVKNNYPDAVLVFILPPDFEELKKRLIGRATEDEATVNLRLNNAKKEMEFLSEYNYSIVNEFVDDSVKKMEAIILAERLKIKK